MKKMVLFGFLMSIACGCFADEQAAFDEGTAFGESQINNAMTTLKNFNAAAIGTQSADASSMAQQSVNASLSGLSSAVNNQVIQQGEVIEANAPQTAQESGGFCVTGDCKNTQTTPSDDFDQSGSELSGVSSAGEDIQQEQQGVNIKNPTIATMIPVKAFGGASIPCSYDSVSFKNCCANKGTGISIGLSCSTTEKNLAKAVQEDRAFEVGSYCSKKIPLVGCVEHRKVYCQFPSLLDRIIQTDGRSRQLHIPFGPVDDDHHDANCRGLYPDEIDRIDFDQCDATHPTPNCIDYTEYYQQMESKMQVPS
jgi:conjugal transfer mating pair stabilization protein TraN